MFGRRNVAALVAEFLGTGILTLLILSVQRSTIGVPFFVALAAGLTYALMNFAFGRTSGALLNPALTIGMFFARKISVIATLLFVIVQLLGAWAAYGLYHYFVNQKLQSVGGHFTGRILIAEAVGTGIFSFGVAAAFYQRFNAAVTASVSGLAYMVGIVGASSASIGLLNPAVAFGVRAWVWTTYVAGPILGAIIGFNLYGMLFAEPETAVVGAAVSPATTTLFPTTTRNKVKPSVVTRKTAKVAITPKPSTKRKKTTKKK